MDVHLRIRTLGSLSFQLRGEHIAGFSSRKEAALLVYLAVEKKTIHRRESLFALLWPGMPESSARNNLRQVLYQLRQRIPERPARNSAGTIETENPVPLLLVDRQTVQINPAAAVMMDLWRLNELANQVEEHDCAKPADCLDCQAALREVVALYQGEFLAGFCLEDSNQFEDWAEANRESARRQVLEVLGRRTEICIKEQDYPGAQGYAQHQLRIDPLCESAHRQLIEALARRGHRARALRQYRVCLNTLERELGVAPSQDTTVLYERIRAEKVALGVSEITASDPPKAVTFPVLAAAKAPDRFLGRERELACLQDFLTRSQSEGVQVVFISGDPGRGKTALMAAFARMSMAVDPELLVAQGNCRAFSGAGDPYLPFREIISQLSGDVAGQYSRPPLSNHQAKRLWANAARAMQKLVDCSPYLVERFVPANALLERARGLSQGKNEWLDTFQIFVERAQRSSGELPQSALFEQVANLLRALAGKSPLLLLMDDLQWSDQGSLQMLAHLVQRLKDVPVCLVGAYRPEEVALGRDGERHPLVPILHEFKRRFGEIEIDLQDGDEQTDRAFVDALLDSEPNQLDEAFRERFFKRTQGHPLFTVELLRAMQKRGDLVHDPQLGWVAGQQLGWEGLPARITAVIAERVERLDYRLREILAVASVEGEVFTAQVIAQVEGMPERDLFQVLTRELEAGHQLVREDREVQVGGRYLARYRFTHALFQEYFYHGLGAGERRLLHGEVGEALEGLYAGQTDRVLAELAQHYAAAGWVEQAVHYLREAGLAAAESYAYREAVDYFSRALALAPEGDKANRFALLAEREETLDALDDRLAQRTDIERMLVLAGDLDAAAQARVALRQVYHAVEIGEYDQAIGHAQAALELALQAGEQILAARAYCQWGESLQKMGKYRAAQAQFQKGLQLSQSVGDQREIATILNSLGFVNWIQGSFKSAKEYFEIALVIFREIGDRRGESDSLGGLGVVARAQGDHATARRYDRQALAIAQEIGDQITLLGWLFNLAHECGEQGNYTDGKRHLGQLVKIYQERGDRRAEGWTLSWIGLMCYHQGDDQAARDYKEQALAIFRKIGFKRGEATNLRELSYVLWRQGDGVAAQEYLKQSLAICQEMGERGGEGGCWNELGAVALAEGNLPLAENHYQKASIIRRELNQSQYLVEDWAGLAKVKLAQVDLQSAREFAAQVMDYLQAHPRPTGAEHPSLMWPENRMRTFHFTWEVWLALDDTPKADAVLALATAMIHDYLDKNPDPDAQAMYLRQPYHAILWRAWKEKAEHG